MVFDKIMVITHLEELKDVFHSHIKVNWPKRGRWWGWCKKSRLV